MYIKDGSPYDADEDLYAWGWIGESIEGETWGDNPVECHTKRLILAKLKPIATAHQTPDGELIKYLVDCTRGLHICEICGECLGNASIKISHNGRIYVSPSDVYHYIEGHNYKPADEVIAAVLEGYYCTQGDLMPSHDFGSFDKRNEAAFENKMKLLRNATLLKGCFPKGAR